MSTAIIGLDASPIIFLGKLGQLRLLEELALGHYLLPEAVRAEILVPTVASELRPVLEQFLGTCETVVVEEPPAFAPVLSHADRCLLALAIRRRAKLVVADDLPLRKLLALHHIAPLGTLGLFLLAVKRQLMTADTALEQMHALVVRHQFRVTVEVYADFLRRLRTGNVT